MEGYTYVCAELQRNFQNLGPLEITSGWLLRLHTVNIGTTVARSAGPVLPPLILYVAVFIDISPTFSTSLKKVVMGRADTFLFQLMDYYNLTM